MNIDATPGFSDILQSGEWRGVYLQPSRTGIRHMMEMSLSFDRGIVRGDGRDPIGAFSFIGRYHTGTGRVDLVKQYIGQHRVHYHGWAEDGKGIYGVWTIRSDESGGFCLWPKGMSSPDGICEEAEDDIPAEELVPALAEPAAQAIHSS